MPRERGDFRLANAPPVIPRGALRVLLTDAPIEGDVSAVNVCFQAITVSFVDDEEAPATTVAQGIGTLNLLELRDGVTAVIAEADLPADLTIDELRIILCERGNNIVVDGVVHDLITPSGQQSGLKLKPRGGLRIRAGEVSIATVDFDAAESIHYASGHGFILEPVIHLIEGAFVTIATPEAQTAVAAGPLVVTGEADGPPGDPVQSVTVNGAGAELSGTSYRATVTAPEGPATLHLAAVVTTAAGATASAEIDVVVAEGPADDGQTEEIPAYGFDRTEVQQVSLEVSALPEGGFLVRASCDDCIAAPTVERWTAADNPFAREPVPVVVEEVAGATDTFRVLHPDEAPGALLGFDVVARIAQMNGGPAFFERAAVLGRFSLAGEFEQIDWEEFVCAAGFATCGVDETGEPQVDLHLGGAVVQP